MTFPTRRKPIALLLCCGLASVLAGGHSTVAYAQGATPLRVDPALLGLPPITADQAPAKPVAGDAASAGVEVKPVSDAVVDSKPVEPGAEKGGSAGAGASGDGKDRKSADEAAAGSGSDKIKRKPPQASPNEIPARGAVPAGALPQAADIAPAPMPQPKAVEMPAVVPAGRKPREDEQPAQPGTTQAGGQPAATRSADVAAATAAADARVAAVRQTATEPGSASAPLRVDPRLLDAGSATPPAAAAANAPTTRRVAPIVLAAAGPTAGDGEKSWLHRVWDPVTDAYQGGDWELYLPFHTYHLRSKYTAQQIASYQEKPPGFGFGKGYYNEAGNWEGVYAMGFQDSHFKPSYVAGYGWKAIWHPLDDVRLGLGYTAGLMTRADVFGYKPFPIVLPMASLAYKNLSLETTFVPGAKGAGNIFFFWMKWEFGKKDQPLGTPTRVRETESSQLAHGARPAAPPVDLAPRLPAGPAVTALGSGTATGGGSVTGGDATTGGSVQTGTAVEAWSPGWLSGGAGPAGAEAVPDSTPALALRPARSMTPLAKDKDKEQRPVFLSALRMGGEVDNEFVAEGEAELRKIGTVVNSDRLIYWPIEDEVEAEGHVVLEQGDDRVSGPKMRLRLEDQVGYFEQPSYVIKRQPSTTTEASDQARIAAFLAQDAKGQGGEQFAWNAGFATPNSAYATTTDLPKTATEGRGEADRIDFEGENHIRLTNSTYTTCKPGNDDWYMRTESLKLDYDREVGEGSNGTVYFKDTPIFYSPWLSFSLNNERKSGFLAPTFGTNSVSGVEFSLPYYWNIAPNMDATITPREMTKRGLQLNNEFRYLDTAYGGMYSGEIKAELLPNDQLRGSERRYGYSWVHNQTTPNGFTALINYNKVSDDNYYTDLSSQIANTANTQLLQQAQLTYSGGGWWNATANLQQYQTLQPDVNNPVQLPYKMLPQLTLNARQPDLFGTDSSFLGQYTNFSIDQRVQFGQTYPDGQRTILYPQIALPYVTPGWYVTPKLGVNYRNYSLTGQVSGMPDALSVTLPIFSVDAGMTFERSSNWFGRDYTQTLEPRLYYLNVPFRDQSNIPLFDTALADFNFAQIFSENQYSGWDRISDANQLTAAATTRLLDPASGNEVMRAMLGQRFYFRQTRVGLNSTLIDSSDDHWQKSDVLAAFSGQILPKVYVDAAWDYNLADRQTQRYSTGVRYVPEPGKVLNASYRYSNDVTAPVDQVDVSGQWPLGGRWHAVGRANYSFKDDGTNTSLGVQGGRLIESLGGIEYNGGCWVLRTVIRRSAVTSINASTSLFIQLELNDFSRIGSSPLDLLNRSVQGYTLINGPQATPATGNE